MKNNFVANLVLCKKISEEQGLVNVFNNLDLKKKTIDFVIGIFLTKNIVELKEEMLFINLVYENEDQSIRQQHPFGTIVKKFQKIGTDIEFSSFRCTDIEMKWEGFYRVELYHCKEVKDINQLTSEEVINLVQDSEVLSSYTFSVNFV